MSDTSKDNDQKSAADLVTRQNTHNQIPVREEIKGDPQAGSASMGTKVTEVDCAKRRLLIATSVVGGAGVALTAVPFLSSLSPSERAKAAGAPVEIDVSTVKEGEMRVVEWRGKPVWILRRSPEMLKTLSQTEDKVADPKSDRKLGEVTPKYCKNQHRSIKPELLVAVGICSHLGCSPVQKFQSEGDWVGGFACPCHGSTFDYAGRVYKNKPAPDNLEVPPHRYVSDSMLLIGDDNA